MQMEMVKRNFYLKDNGKYIEKIGVGSGNVKEK